VKRILLNFVVLVAALGISGCDFVKNFVVEPETEYVFLGENSASNQIIFDLAKNNEIVDDDLKTEDYLEVLIGSFNLINEDSLRKNGVSLALNSIDKINEKIDVNAKNVIGD